MSLRLDWCSHEAAKYACERWHYSQSIQPGKTVKIGVWEAGVFIGAILFTMGSGGLNRWAIGDIRPHQIAELARVALRQHEAPVSRMVRIAITMLRKQSPGLRLLISYADPIQGHHGGIYQAGGWLYLGETEPSSGWVAPDGHQYHSREIGAYGKKVHFGALRQTWRQDECQKVELPGKYKYVMPLDARMRAYVLPLTKPYPKTRVRSETGDTADVQSAEGSSTLTRTLQTKRKPPAG